MIRSPRLASWCCAGLLGGVPVARAADVPKTGPPATSVEVEEQHRYSPKTQAIVGAAGAASVIVSVALIADSFVRYNVIASGSDGHSCRPCTPSQIAGPRVEFGVGLGLLAVGVALGVTAGILAVSDRHWQRDHQKLSAVRLDAGGVHF